MSAPTLSIIVPAWNEEKYLERTLASLYEAVGRYERERGGTAEIIVVDNNSQDKTALVARAQGATVVAEPINNIARARNTGARAARGQYLAFCDADNCVTPNMFCRIHDHLQDPRIVGGGTGIKPERRSLKILFFYTLWHLYVILSRVGVGVMHCRRADFETIGGYNETMYAAEDLQLAYDLRKLGKPRGQKFKLLRQSWIITSTRKLDQASFAELFVKMIGFGFGLQKKVRSKEYCKHWYDKAAR